MMKKAASTFALSLLLIGCGSQHTPTSHIKPTPPSTTTPTFNGLDVVGQPNILKRRVTLPTQTDMPMMPGSQIRSQSLLPAWTGPRTFVGGIDWNNYNSWRFDINSKGEFFAQNHPTRMNKSQPLELYKYSSTGQLLFTQKSSTTGYVYDPRLPASNHWLLVTEDNATEETYQLFSSYSNEYYGNLTKDYEQVLAEVYSTSLVPLRSTTDPIYPVFFFNPPTAPLYLYDSSIAMKSGGKGVVVSSFAANPSGPGTAVNIYEISHQPWEEVGVTSRNTLLTPKELPDAHPMSVFDTVSDGSIYSAVFVPYDPNCNTNGCPMYAVLTKFLNGNVVWQNYWESADPIYRLDITASKNGVSLMIVIGKQVEFNRKSTLLTFSADGAPVSNVRVPLEKFRDELTYLPAELRDQYVDDLVGIKSDDSGKIVAYGNNYLLSGSLANGFTHSFLYKDGKTGDPYQVPGNTIFDVLYKGGYVYALTNDSLVPLDSALQPR